jgi:hypothetical protein
MIPFMSSYDSLSATFYTCGKATNIKTVELRNAVLCNELRDARIALGHPSKELGDTHDGWWFLVIAW